MMITPDELCEKLGKPKGYFDCLLRRGASELIALPADGVEIGMVFQVVDLLEYEWGVQEEIVENFIFGHWLIKVQRPRQQLYSTQLAATGLAVQLYRNEIKEIEAKIKALEDFSGDDHPDSAEN